VSHSAARRIHTSPRNIPTRWEGLRVRPFSLSILAVPPSPKPDRSGPPHNPGVRDLVSNKRRWSSPPKREDAVLGFRGWHERGYLPHRDETGLTQFITFHLADAFPKALRSEWAALLEIEDDLERRRQLEAYLDKAAGRCHLRRPEIGALVDRSLRFHHGRWYELVALCVMPNHVHLLLKLDTTPISKIVAELKRYTARESNTALPRQGAL